MAAARGRELDTCVSDIFVIATEIASQEESGRKEDGRRCFHVSLMVLLATCGGLPPQVQLKIICR